MNVSLDISLYPLDERFVEIILDFIDRIGHYPTIKVVKNTLSTQLFGDYDEIMEMMQKEMKISLQQLPHSIFVLKLVGTDRTPDILT